MKNIKTYDEFDNEFQTFLDFSKDITNINLKLLLCNNKKLIDLNGIETFKKLSEVDCSVNKLTSLKGIENLTELGSIWCHDNKITSLKGIENSTKLNYLSCWNNLLTSLEGIENLINLKTLDCSDNKITSLKPILDLTKLETIHCNRNPIDWVDYVDKKGNKWYIVLPKSIEYFISDKFKTIAQYWNFMDQNQPIAVSRKFNF